MAHTEPTRVEKAPTWAWWLLLGIAILAFAVTSFFFADSRQPTQAAAEARILPCCRLGRGRPAYPECQGATDVELTDARLTARIALDPACKSGWIEIPVGRLFRVDNPGGEGYDLEYLFLSGKRVLIRGNDRPYNLNELTGGIDNIFRLRGTGEAVISIEHRDPDFRTRAEEGVAPPWGRRTENPCEPHGAAYANERS